VIPFAGALNLLFSSTAIPTSIKQPGLISIGFRSSHAQLVDQVPHFVVIIQVQSRRSAEKIVAARSQVWWMKTFLFAIQSTDPLQVVQLSRRGCHRSLLMERDAPGAITLDVKRRAQNLLSVFLVIPPGGRHIGTKCDILENRQGANICKATSAQ
jgi:hypothetical protein